MITSYYTKTIMENNLPSHLNIKQRKKFMQLSYTNDFLFFLLNKTFSFLHWNDKTKVIWEHIHLKSTGCHRACATIFKCLRCCHSFVIEKRNTATKTQLILFVLSSVLTSLTKRESDDCFCSSFWIGLIFNLMLQEHLFGFLTFSIAIPFTMHDCETVESFLFFNKKKKR